jgi:hypothetical protein
LISERIRSKIFLQKMSYLFPPTVTCSYCHAKPKQMAAGPPTDLLSPRTFGTWLEDRGPVSKVEVGCLLLGWAHHKCTSCDSKGMVLLLHLYLECPLSFKVPSSNLSEPLIFSHAHKYACYVSYSARGPYV